MNARLDIAGILERAGADASAPEGSQAWSLAQVSAAAEGLIRDNTAMRDLLQVQDQAMAAYRELVEHRNRQIYALGGEP